MGGDRFDQVLAHIEANLFEPLSVGGLAAVAGLSAFHFSRLFTARVGESVMSHVRRKRMLHAAARLRGARPPALAELAFDCGFESQEAFTRCFKQVFGVTPGHFRRDLGQSQIMMERQMPTLATAKPNLALLDGIKHRDAFTVAGLSTRIEGMNKEVIPTLWPRLFQHLPIAGRKGGESYGVCWGADLKEGSFNYMAAVEIEPGARPPEEFTTLKIPAQSYRVFRLTLDGGEIHPQMKAAVEEIWSERLPKSGWRLTSGIDFESYGAAFNPTAAGAVIDIHVPVEA
ncbi:MAG TPA: AraC family transcriptional regulator [Dongiaceae bacterium]|nr:AraC family transcriptional regulator [Dongiaceae bacterium]